MSAHVDVLAVKPAVLSWLKAMRDATEPYQRDNVMTAAISGIGLLFDERDAAVAELIEAAGAGTNLDYSGARSFTRTERVRLDAALARCKGGAL